MAALLAQAAADARLADSCQILEGGQLPLPAPPFSDGPVLLWPMYVFSWMHAVMHEKRFALHGHKSTDGLNVEEEIIGKTTLLVNVTSVVELEGAS